QRIVKLPGALEQGLDDLDRPDLVGEVREIGRLVTRAGADLEDLLAPLRVDRVGHAGDRMRAGYGDAEADVEIVPLIGTVEVLAGDELFTWREKIGPLVTVFPHIMVRDERLEAVEALPEETGILTAVLDHPLDEGAARVRRR